MAKLTAEQVATFVSHFCYPEYVADFVKEELDHFGTVLVHSDAGVCFREDMTEEDVEAGFTKMDEDDILEYVTNDLQ